VLTGKDLIIGVDEKNTGNLTVGAGFSSMIRSLGLRRLRKATSTCSIRLYSRARAEIPLRRRLEPSGRTMKCLLSSRGSLAQAGSGVDLFYRDPAVLSLNDMYDETQAGARLCPYPGALE
jgi:hypothetical protein